MASVTSNGRERAVAALIAAALQGLLVYALIVGLAVSMPAVVDDALQVFGIVPDPPKPAVEIIPPKQRSKRPEGAASPPNLRSKATEIVAPPPVVVTPPPPIVAATVAGVGIDATSGAADVVGPGTGSGGIGDGTGSGGSGDGDGGGGIDETPPRWLSGRIRDSDYPEALKEAMIGGTVSVRYVVETTGRVRDCEVTRSSGARELDSATCALIERRFRYRPSLDSAGRPVAAVIVENHSWLVDD